jgi:hypothetical protein
MRIEGLLTSSPVCDRLHSSPDRLRVRFALCRPTTARIRVGVTEHGKSASSEAKCMTGWPETRCCGSRTNTSASPIGLKSRLVAFQPFRSRLARVTTGGMPKSAVPPDFLDFKHTEASAPCVFARRGKDAAFNSRPFVQRPYVLRFPAL